MLVWKHVLVLAVATVTAVILCLFLVRYSADTRPDDGNEELEADVLYKYRHLLDAARVRPLEKMAQRERFLSSVCDKYDDPFRVEHRGLHKIYPPHHHFTHFGYKGQGYLTCNLHKVASNSWKTFLHKVQEKLQRQGSDFDAEPIENEVNEECWPECGKEMDNIIIVRHPLERVLSAYRSEYEGKRGELSWPGFVDLLISNGLGPEPGARDSKTLQPPAWYHTAPYWKHCGLCRPELRPKYILHMDKLALHSKVLLSKLGMGQMNVTMPHHKTGHGGHTMGHNLAYYSQLSKKQVWGLYNLYRVDHELFGYTANAFIDVAQ